MNNREAWEDYSRYTRDVTELGRRLAFGAAGICWILKLPDGRLATPLLVALGCVAVFFTVDILQHVLGAKAHRRWIRGREKALYVKTGLIEGDYLKPATLDTWPHRLWWVKVVVLLGAFVAIAVQVIRQLAIRG